MQRLQKSKGGQSVQDLQVKELHKLPAQQREIGNKVDELAKKGTNAGDPRSRLRSRA